MLFIALGGIGLPGGAVYVRTWSMTKRQRTTVSLAGPFANVVLAIVLLLVTAAVLRPRRTSVFWAAMAFLGFLQVTAVLLNLLPIPGLDGYGALEPHLSPETQRQLEPVKQWGFLDPVPPAVHRRCSTSGSSARCLRSSSCPASTSTWSRAGSQLTRFWSAWL